MAVPLPIIYSHRCTGCGDCVARCPHEALALQDGKAILARPDLCTYCTACEDVCPSGAISLPFLVVFAKDRQPSQ